MGRETRLDPVSSIEDRLPLSVDPTRWSLLYHTARNMHTEQFLGTLDRKIRHLLVPYVPFDFDAYYERKIPNKPEVETNPVSVDLSVLRGSLARRERDRHRERAFLAREGQITFLNRTIDLGTDQLQWEHPEIDSLPIDWRLKLQSFAFLEWLYLGYDDPNDAPRGLTNRVERWLLDWTRTHRIGERNYLRRNWIPHSVSLRIANLCRYYAWLGPSNRSRELETELPRAIFKNALFLENHVEFDVGGNHLIENAFALVVAGVFFEADPRDWLKQGLNVFTNSADQFLSDGGHFERSPMYHIQSLSRYVSALGLLDQTRYSPPSAVRKTAKQGTEFLTKLTPPDDRIPLLNDSVFDETLSLRSCLRYAARTGISVNYGSSNRSLPHTGYYWLGKGKTKLLIDGGPVGPPHLPGHSHNDLLSFIHWQDGRRVFTDSGIYSYVGDDLRQYARGVRGHNTVQVGDSEPIDIGGKYLMGKRTKPTVKQTTTDQVETFDGSYQRKSSPSYVHERSVDVAEGWWLVKDDVTSRTDHPVRSRLHLHPSLSALRGTRGGVPFFEARTEDGTRIGRVFAVSDCDLEISNGYYFPRFGEKRERTTLEFNAPRVTNALELLFISQQVGSGPEAELLDRVTQFDPG